MKKIPKKKADTYLLVNFKLHRNIVKVLDSLVESGLYKTRIDIVLSALRNYNPFEEMWKIFHQEIWQETKF